MKLALLTAIAMSLMLSPAYSDAAKRIRKEAEFRQVVVGKTLANGAGSFVIASNGTMKGRFKRGAYRGNWAWSRGYFCRKAILGKTKIAMNCLSVHVKDNAVLFGRDKGKGSQSQFVMK